MTRISFNNYSNLNKFINKRKEYTITKNNSSEPFKHCSLGILPSGAIIGYGGNRATQFGSHHSEEVCLKSATRYIRKNKSKNINSYKRRIRLVLVVIRTNGGNSKPCYHCITEQIANHPVFNIRKVIYSDNNATDGYVNTNTNKLYENKEEHYSGFHMMQMSNKNANINNNHNHEHDDCEEDDCAEEDDEEKAL